MQAYLAEFIGTMILIILGDGVVAGVLLKNSKAENSGWIVITVGWAVAVAIAVYCVGQYSGAHINPAVTIALAVTGQFGWVDVPGYIIAQFAGAFVGAIIVWLAYLAHWAPTEDAGLKLGVFSTAPAYRATGANMTTEIIGRYVVCGSGGAIRWLSNGALCPTSPRGTRAFSLISAISASRITTSSVNPSINPPWTRSVPRKIDSPMR